MQLLQDGGGIKTIFVENFVIRSNVVSCNRLSEGLRPAYYLDEFSVNCVVSNNLSVNIRCIGLYHMSRKNLLKSNVFIGIFKKNVLHSNTGQVVGAEQPPYTPGVPEKSRGEMISRTPENERHLKSTDVCIFLDPHVELCHNEHMRTISIRELHMETGKWIRSAARDQKIVGTERGHPIATIRPYSMDDVSTPFSRRRETDEFKNLEKVDSDSAMFVSDDRH